MSGDDASASAMLEAQQQLRRLQRRMRLWVGLVTLGGLVACSTVLLLAAQRSVYREHYEFRRQVRVGMTREQVIRTVGKPYRTYATLRAITPVLQGRGAYRWFSQDVLSNPPAKVTSQPGEQWFKEVLHYRPTIAHGEFVFIGHDGRVLIVITARR